MHFPEAPGIECLTPGVEYVSDKGYFTNLYEFDASSVYIDRNESYVISAYGELKNKYQQQGGIGYGLKYNFFDSKLVKSVSIRYS